MMTTTLKLTAKNQLTLKKEFLTHLGISTGDEMEVFKLPDGALKIKAKPLTPQKRTFADVSGFFKGKTNVSLNLDEINDAISDAWNESGKQGTE